tara:strand:- start:361 stop:1101 length:741 start_codon:yes stop_codon:yes gene_type:complete
MIIYLAIITSFIFPSEMCSLCSKPLSKNFLTDSWGNNFHPNHIKESIFCKSCNRVISESITQGGYILSDSRYICNLCHQSSITENSQIKKIKKTSINFMQKLGLDITDSFNINLIDQNTLLDNLKGHRLHSTSFQAITKCHEKECNIYILDYLPKILFQSILIHEMTHVWLRQNNVVASLKKEEGFCNLVSSYFLKNQQSKFSSILLNNLFENTDSIYGDGYRLMNKKLDEFGWEKIINDFKIKEK